MGNELQSLSHLFQNRLFRIPDYQRGYAWKQEQLVDFWDDLMNLQMDRYHYTGLLSIKTVPKTDILTWNDDDKWLLSTGFQAFHVVDGQQRLTTIAILLNEIVAFVKNMECNNGKSDDEIVLGNVKLSRIKEKYILQKRPPQDLVTTYLFGYETDDPSADYLKYKVYSEPYGGTVNETYYTKNLKYAKEFFVDCLSKLNDAEGIIGIENTYQKLTLRLMFNIHEIEDDYDVFVAFETMNNRGKKLTNLERLKNRLIYLTTLFDNKELDTTDKNALRKQINSAWKEVYYQLGRNQHTPLSDDEFLRAHWIIYFQYSRKKGDDYIKSLLSKFSAKSIFKKKTIAIDEETMPENTGFEIDEDDDAQAIIETEPIITSELEPSEIRSYVNSLKEMAQYWYDSYFPLESSDLTYAEKECLDRLNHIGIGYFRPMVVASLTPAANATVEERVSLFKAIERFIFICFRMAAYQSSYMSSDYYRKAKDIYTGVIDLSVVTQDINDTADKDMTFAIKNFITRMDKKFVAGVGFYGWHDLQYFLFEYEYTKAIQNNLPKVNWSLFTKVEKDKITIEHILPQTPNKWYWRNQFRQFTEDEVKILSGSLGNLLPLSQSINSSLQNDSFYDKKKTKADGRRGYENGSHSEIEVAQETDWDAARIMNRGLKLLRFMEKRWHISFEDENQMLDLLHVGFVKDNRIVPPEVQQNIAPENTQVQIRPTKPASDISNLRLAFWTAFVEYCTTLGRDKDLVSRKPRDTSYYDVSIGSGEYNMFFNIVKSSEMQLGIYVFEASTFKRLESKKEDIEKYCGFHLEWYTSRLSSAAKRILYITTADIYNPDEYKKNFDWFINHYDKLFDALKAFDNI